MGNRLRFRSGHMELRRVRVEIGTVIEAGDLVYLSNGYAKPAGDFAWDNDLATTQGAFAAVFLGVAQQGSLAGQTDDVSVDVSPHAIYEFDVESSTFEIGTLLGVDGASDALNSQRLLKVNSAAQAIARAVEYRVTETSALRIQFASSCHTGSANVNSAIG